MATIRLPSDFKEFLRLLNEHRVEYLLIGGYAVGYHGYPRATVGMDIWVAVNPSNAGRLVAVLKAFGFDQPGLSAEWFLKDNQVVRMGVPPVRIEIVTTISGVRFEACHAARVEAEVDGVTIPFISRGDLKTNKKASGRHKDLDDLEHLT